MLVSVVLVMATTLATEWVVGWGPSENLLDGRFWGLDLSGMDEGKEGRRFWEPGGGRGLIDEGVECCFALVLLLMTKLDHRIMNECIHSTA